MGWAVRERARLAGAAGGDEGLGVAHAGCEGGAAKAQQTTCRKERREGKAMRQRMEDFGMLLQHSIHLG